MKNINIIDPGLKNLLGHHFDLDLRICKALNELGFNVHIYGSLRSDENIIKKFKPYGTYHPTFRVGPYVNPDNLDPIAGSYIAFTQHSTVIAHDLKSINTIGDWIFPTFFASHLNACALLNVKNSIYGILQLPVETQFAQDDVYWRFAIINASLNNLDLKLGIIEPELLFEYQRVAGDKIKIEILPIPYEFSCEASSNNKLNVVGFFGQQRGEKGSEELLKLSNDLANDNYHIILHNCAKNSLTTDHKNIRKVGFVDDLSQLISSCDCVVLPYSMKQYRSKGSGILYDALAAGVPLIAPSDTALGRWIVKSNSGVLFYEQNIKSIMKAIEQLSHNYLFYKKNALAFKKFWQQEHGISQFISKLLINS